MYVHFGVPWSTQRDVATAPDDIVTRRHVVPLRRQRHLAPNKAVQPGFSTTGTVQSLLASSHVVGFEVVKQAMISPVPVIKSRFWVKDLRAGRRRAGAGSQRSVTVTAPVIDALGAGLNWFSHTNGPPTCQRPGGMERSRDVLSTTTADQRGVPAPKQAIHGHAAPDVLQSGPAVVLRWLRRAVPAALVAGWYAARAAGQGAAKRRRAIPHPAPVAGPPTRRGRRPRWVDDAKDVGAAPAANLTVRHPRKAPPPRSGMPTTRIWRRSTNALTPPRGWVRTLQNAQRIRCLLDWLVGLAFPANARPPPASTRPGQHPAGPVRRQLTGDDHTRVC